MKKIPYGITDYEELITEGYYYVDKTMYLEKMERDVKVLTYLRPRRFGKTLFTSMMYYYYDIKSSDKFDTLFKDTYVYKNPTRNKNNYYVLKFDFSGINTFNKDVNSLVSEFTSKVIDGIKMFNEYYNIEMNDITENLLPNKLLLNFLANIRALKLDHKLYVIVDEYDKFTNAILEDNADLFKEILSDSGFVRTFYEVIKEKTGTIIDRTFITGVCSISLDSMTSGFNISTDITNDIEFNAMVSFTHDEVKELMSDIEEDKREKIFNTMLENYDGYLFNTDVDERVFNATLVMKYLRDYYRLNKEPDKLFDGNIISSYEQIKNIITLQNNTYYNDILNKLLEDGEIDGVLKDKFTLTSNVSYDDIVSLLYYFGYITIKEQASIDGEELTFRIPNKVMERVFRDYFINLLEEIDINIDEPIVKMCTKEMMEEGKIDKFSNYISELLSLADGKTYRNFDEKYINLLYFYILLPRKGFRVYNELKAGNGYADLVLKGNKGFTNYDIVVEFKYIKKEDYNSNVLNKKKEEAIEQLKRYKQDRRLSNNILRCYAIIFVGNELKLIEEV